MIKIIVPGKPISKSNFKLQNIHGQFWMPRQGKHSKYIAYENTIAGHINQQYHGSPLEGSVITIIKLFFPNRQMGDIHNYPKSICDGIEKSGVILNDKQLKPVLLFDYIDKDHPRIEIELYESSRYNIQYTIEPNDPPKTL
ncbi:MAG: RusA family crossover junction endodeoxyribonuclease [Anaerosolibacter sp.]|jgi:Holliday junction resolvase RusA-like endonuclease|uniref:RusA family crossover junction endodeoxyribonuclease n=1 Tax=Anaerosolibacter sp. TaxID=1872527 RepID=UPI002635F383|nr:RusA family crossover junction endodeoxyribonuclease [Anaerosolibacter sp.]MDF2546243.1 RusA family crossover junction endodeoxyribonuclease [Anaerosolibacter sp.]